MRTLLSFKSISLLVQQKKRFSRQPPWLPSWIFEKDLATFDLQMNPDTKFRVSWPFRQEKLKIDFQDGSHPGFPIGTILANFYLPVTPMLPTKFSVNWPFGSGEEAKKDFQDGGHGLHL